MFFFVLLNIILFFFCLYFYFEQKKLKQKIIDLEQETKIILERKIINNKEDLVSIDDISIETTEKSNLSINTKEDLKENQKEELPKPELYKEKYSVRSNNTEYLEPKIEEVSPTVLNSDNHMIKTTNVSIEQNFDPIEFIKKEQDKKIVIEENNSNNSNNEYLREISKQIEKQLTPQTIELTDYEKNQEEQAIISYQELLSLKEKNNNEGKQNHQ